MITTYLFRKGQTLQSQVTRSEMLSAIKDRDSLLWVDLEDPTDFESEFLVEIFNFHPLAIEDCINDHSEPKMDDYDEHLFLVVHGLTMARDEEKELDELKTIELNIFFGKNYLVTFHKTPIKTMAQVRSSLERRPERLMGHGSDLLLHAILDRLVDNYQPVLDQYDAKIDQLEECLFNMPAHDYLATVMQAKRDVFNLRRIIAPQRDLISNLTRIHTDFISQEHMMYFRDVYDHLFRIYGLAESFHESLASILQVYFSYSSNKLNEVVKHMTVMATLTMPSVIIASMYGMNFEYMPELHWKFGYPFSIALSLGISGALLVWMKLKKWI